MSINERYQTLLNGAESVRLGVAVALINEYGSILLELRSDVEMWGVTGGRLDPGETPAECAIREIYEETGVELSSDKLFLSDVYGSPSDGRILQYPDNRVHLIDILYVARISSCSTLHLSHESLALEFFPASQIPTQLVPPAVRPIRDLISSNVIT